MARTVADIQADLVQAYAARRAALTGEYSLDSGQSRQTVRRSLKEIRAWVRELEQELEEAQNPGGGIISANFRRYG